LPIIVDKAQKRKDIALSCSELLHKKGIKKLTVAEVAKTAGVAKGSIYDYFENKEDIVFEIIRHDIEEYQKCFQSKVNPNATTREKVFLVFSFLLTDDNNIETSYKLYKEYMSIDLGGECENMKDFNTECGSFFRNMITFFIQEGIEKGEIVPEAINLTEGLLAIEKGFLIILWTERKDIKKDVTQFLNTLFDLIEVKNEY